MKVFPTAKDETFSLSELASALELVRNQHAITQGDHQADEVTHTADDVAVDDVGSGYCPACSQRVQGFTLPIVNNNVAAADNVADDSDTVAPVNNVAPVTPVPQAAATQAAPPNLHTSTSVSQRWYVITVGRETGVFQGWHNVHVHVIGVPGACFGRYSSQSTAQVAYAQALNDGSVSRLPL
ncbi:hypothetical protein CY34DRAFT_17287 [Suillus luteus UH-Slu-Lm8-n1]|uniref:Ribonuclease H1 N-terminal domain-containing protein n=1 Tax=Suillus luteus UH-Slu-Lm8-n1 TaxID=930992 RepID=A0A0C9ZZX4_9AGAM|nr:hypothetical protein CY34DRAFT_17287 [Suillus luteus UH-Slu-Lm8-n1]